MFWLGETNEDGSINPEEMAEILKNRYKEIKQPKVGDIVAWHAHLDKNRIHHAGLVEKIGKEIKVKSRLGDNGIIEILPQDRVWWAIPKTGCENLDKKPYTIKYYEKV